MAENSLDEGLLKYNSRKSSQESTTRDDPNTTEFVNTDRLRGRPFQWL